MGARGLKGLAIVPFFRDYFKYELFRHTLQNPADNGGFRYGSMWNTGVIVAVPCC